MYKLLIITCFVCIKLVSSAQGQSKDSVPVLMERLHNSSADTNRVNLLISISNAYTLKPGEEASDLNHAIETASKALALSNTLKYETGAGMSYTAIARALREKGDTSAKRYAQKAVTILQNSSDKFAAADAWKEVGNNYKQEDEELGEKIKCYQKAVDLLKQTNQLEQYARTLQFLADLNKMNGSTALSLMQATESLRVYKSIGCQDLQGVYDLLAQGYTTFNNYENALTYAFLAVRLAENQKDSGLQMCENLNHVGMLYYKMSDYKKAIEFFQKSIVFAEKNNDSGTVLMLASNIANMMLYLNHPQEVITYLNGIVKKYPITDDYTSIQVNSFLVAAYNRLKQYKKAQEYFFEIDSLVQTIPKYSEYRSFVYRVGIPLFFDLHNLSKSKEYLAAFIDYAEHTTYPKTKADAYHWSFKLDSTEGKYFSAITAYQKYKLIDDSIFDDKRSLQVAGVQVQFETQKKEQDIINLKHKAELQQTKFDQERLIRNVIIGGAVLLLLILLLLYNRYRLKQKTNNQLILQQQEINQKNRSLQELIQELHKLINEKEWLVKEIHHRVKNNLQIVVSLLNTQAAHLNEGEALNAISESQHRMQAISLLHQKLYHHNNDSSISMNDYITEMVSYLKDSFPVNRIYFDVEIDEITLDVSQAAPVGLILNEAVTNAIKYAFPDNKNGIISIKLKRNMNNVVIFTIADNGVGMPANWQTQKNASMGIKLMETLAEQLEGVIHINSEEGVNVHIEFDTKQEHSAIASEQVNSSVYYA